MSLNCPKCGAVVSGQEPDLGAVYEEMLRADPSQVPVSEAVPFEAMQAPEGGSLAVDPDGEPVALPGVSPAEVAQRPGYRIIPKGGAPMPAADARMLATIEEMLRKQR